MIIKWTCHAVAIVWCAVTTLASNTDGLPKQCEIPSVPLGHPTILTCHYNKTILESKVKIVVLHYCQNDDENPETILFNSFFDDKMEFYTHPDYVLHNNTGEIQVKIPRVTQKHVGRYVCLRLHSDINEECTFTLREHEVTKYDSTSSTLIDKLVTGSIHVTRQNDGYPLGVVMGAIGSIAIICTVVITIIICILLRTRRAEASQPGGDTSVEREMHGYFESLELCFRWLNRKIISCIA